MSEQVLVFPADLLDEVEPLSGFSPDAQTYFDNILSSKRLTFMDRALAEEDPNFKQIIPYQIIHDTSTDTYFNYLRGAKGGEDRLKTKRSLGIGGHINKGDEGADGLQTYYNGALREWLEEVRYNKDGLTDHLLGVIYDPATPVGKVHWGFVNLVELPDDSLEVIDECLVKHCWLTLEELDVCQGLFEPWSQMVIRHLTQTASLSSALSRKGYSG